MPFECRGLRDPVTAWGVAGVLKPMALSSERAESQEAEGPKGSPGLRSVKVRSGEGDCKSQANCFSETAAGGNSSTEILKKTTVVDPENVECLGSSLFREVASVNPEDHAVSCDENLSNLVASGHTNFAAEGRQFPRVSSVKKTNDVKERMMWVPQAQEWVSLIASGACLGKTTALEEGMVSTQNPCRQPPRVGDKQIGVQIQAREPIIEGEADQAVSNLRTLKASGACLGKTMAPAEQMIPTQDPCRWLPTEGDKQIGVQIQAQASTIKVEADQDARTPLALP
jgi:hypothetical protein